jgi:ribosomal protein L12E/L44/L45/RPP1/RPP2
MQTSTTVVTSLKRVSADADALMVALESRIQSSAHALAVREESRFFSDDDDEDDESYEEEEEEDEDDEEEEQQKR